MGVCVAVASAFTDGLSAYFAWVQTRGLGIEHRTMLAQFARTFLLYPATVLVAVFILWKAKALLARSPKLLARYLLWLLSFFVQVRFGALYPEAQQRKIPFYSNLIREHGRMLHRPPKGLARDLPGSWWFGRLSAWVITRDPHFVPRSALLDTICKHYMIPKRWLKHGGDDYGDRLNTDRLLWYHDRKLAVGYTKEEILAAAPDVRQDLLRRTEQRFRTDLARKQGHRRHE